MSRRPWLLLGVAGAVLLLAVVGVLVVRNRSGGDRFVEAPRAEPAGQKLERGLLWVRDQQLLLRNMENDKDFEIRRTDSAGTYYNFPRWSPDGRSIAYVITTQFTAAPGQDWGSDVAISATDGSGERIVFKRSAPGTTVEGIAWSGDGRGLYLAILETTIRDNRFLGQTQRFVLLDIESGTEQPIGEEASYPTVSPDGSRIAYVTAGVNERPGGLWTARPDGSDARLVVRVPPEFDLIRAPKFSPDGSRIAFTAAKVGAGTAASPRQAVAHQPRPEPRRWPWEPRIAAAHGPPLDIWSVPAAGGPATRLTSFLAEDLAFAWSPDGTELALLAVTGLYVLPLPDGQPREIGPGALEAQVDWR